MLFKLKSKDSKRGVIGVACITNLISGGFKALRLGYIPQCILLDYCGCSNHWYNKHIMTDINWNRIDNQLYYKKVGDQDEE